LTDNLDQIRQERD
jgi:hypothetical protein